MDFADEICYVAGNLNRMKKYLDRAKNAHNELGCKEPKCVLELLVNTACRFVFDERLTFDTRKLKFIEICCTYSSIFKTIFTIQQSEYSKLFYELLIKKQTIKKRLEDIEKYIYLMR